MDDATLFENSLKIGEDLFIMEIDDFLFFISQIKKKNIIKKKKIY